MIYPQSRRWVKCYPDSPYPKNGLLHHRHPWSKPGQGHPKVPKVRLGICSNPESSHPFDLSFPWDELKLAYFSWHPGKTTQWMKCTCSDVRLWNCGNTMQHLVNPMQFFGQLESLAPRQLVQAPFWGIYLQGGTQFLCLVSTQYWPVCDDFWLFEVVIVTEPSEPILGFEACHTDDMVVPKWVPKWSQKTPGFSTPNFHRTKIPRPEASSSLRLQAKCGLTALHRDDRNCEDFSAFPEGTEIGTPGIERKVGNLQKYRENIIYNMLVCDNTHIWHLKKTQGAVGHSGNHRGCRAWNCENLQKVVKNAAVCLVLAGIKPQHHQGFWAHNTPRGHGTFLEDTSLKLDSSSKTHQGKLHPQVICTWQLQRTTIML